MKIETILVINHQHKVTVDCFGCDFLDYRDEKLNFLARLQGKDSKRVHFCKALNVDLTDHQVNAYEMTKEECPCQFKKWRQTNADMGEFIEVPTYRFSLSSGGDLMTLEVNDPSLLTDSASFADDFTKERKG